MKIRRQYLDILGDRALDGDVAALVGHGLRWVGTALGPRRGKPLVGPALGTLLVTYRCNLACRVCDLPMRAKARRLAGDVELDTQAFEAVLRDMKAIGTAGVGFTGGEPMLRPDLPDLMAYANRLGLHAHLNTDGLHVADRAEALLATGVRSINLSLDGADATTHDRARGRRGSFQTVLDALGALREARGRGRRPRITAVTVLTAQNIAEAPEVVRVALDAGADRVGVIPVHDFGQGEDAPDADALRASLSALADLHREGAIDNSTGYLDMIPRAFRGEPSPLFCYAPYASVVVDCYGDVFPCFPLMERQQSVGRLPLAALWRSPAYAEERTRLRSCTDCFWNCHTELNLALPQGRMAPSVPPVVTTP